MKNIAVLKPYRLQKLKKVSGKLIQMFSRHREPVQEEPHLPRLLIVDNEESICFSMSEYFEVHGYKVDTARAVEEAERLIETSDYNVVIQDLRLGPTRNINGLDIVGCVRERSRDTRIVVLTAYGSEEMEDEAKRRGADAFLRKPTPLSQVAQVVQGLIEAAQSKQLARPETQQ